jgi:hypothetical protein
MINLEIDQIISANMMLKISCRDLGQLEKILLQVKEWIWLFH